MRCLRRSYLSLAMIVPLKAIVPVLQAHNIHCCRSCSNCPAGKYSIFGGLCTECPKGKYNDNTGQQQCTDCAAGKYSSTVAARSCEDCEAGKSSTEIGATSSSTCTNCTAGKYSTGGQCTDCAAGKYSSTVAATTCIHIVRQENFLLRVRLTVRIVQQENHL